MTTEVATVTVEFGDRRAHLRTVLVNGKRMSMRTDRQVPRYVGMHPTDGQILGWVNTCNCGNGHRHRRVLCIADDELFETRMFPPAELQKYRSGWVYPGDLEKEVATPEEWRAVNRAGQVYVGV